MHPSSNMLFLTKCIFSEEVLSITISKIFNTTGIFFRKFLVKICLTDFVYQSFIKEVNILWHLRSFAFATMIYSFSTIIYYSSIFYFILSASTFILLIISFKRSKRTMDTDMSKLIILVASVVWAISILVLSAITYFIVAEFRWVVRAIFRDMSQSFASVTLIIWTFCKNMFR